MNVKDIKDPDFLKDLDIRQLNELANDIRLFLLDNVSKTGGHLSSNLGVVELSIALHYVFNAPKDKILFDVGHQSYIHKILTGRANKMDSLRKFDGISGFQKRIESEYDCFEAGHSSTALSTALGMAVARDLNKDNYNIVAVVGDGSMMSGLSLEALNQIGFNNNKVIVIFNDNNMSIDKNVGALAKAFNKLRRNKKYNEIKISIKDLLRKRNFGEALIKSIHNLKNKIQNNIVDSGIFDDFDIYYLGPIDGNNIEDLIRVFEIAKEKEYSCVIHCITKKGKGYKYTEQDTTGLWHGVGRFDVETGEFLDIKPDGYLSSSQIVANTIEDLMSNNKDIVTITPAMKIGSALSNISDKYPDRFFDVGIAEDHAICFASGLALSGKRPFVSIYSSFSQRAYDQFNHELSRMNLPVVIGLDRAGLVGDDGETHHGVFDISFLRSLPNVVICQGKDARELKDLINAGFKQDNPYFIRYTRNSLKDDNDYKYNDIKIGSWTYLNKIDNEKCNIISYGEDVEKINEYVIENNLQYNVINARYIKPIDYKTMDKIVSNNKPLFIYTSDIIKGGLYDEILEYLNNKNCNIEVNITGIDDKFIKHGDVELLKKDSGMDLESFFNKISNKVN